MVSSTIAPVWGVSNDVKFGVNTFIWSAEIDRAVLDLLPRIKDHGFDGVELPLIHPALVPSTEIRRTLAATGLECNFCSILPGDLSLISDDPAVRQRTVGHLRDCIKVAADTGASVIAGPLYSPVGYFPGRRRTHDEWLWAVDGYQALATALELHCVTIAIEPLNRFETSFLNTVADATQLASEIGHPQVGVLFDTFHANIEEIDVAAALRSAVPHLKHVHASENNRGIPGTGHTDWSRVFQTLHDVDYEDWVTIESFGFALGELSVAASIWRDLAPHAEDIAFQGVQFLRAGLA
jgi:D-psicose/D-tagatose/L-ribulose 3-epimerase